MRNKINWIMTIGNKIVSNKIFQIIIVSLIFCLNFIAGYIKSTKGINFTDEGFYIATAMRYSLGDIPFKDEFMTHIFPFDKIVAPIFFLFPNISLLEVRLIGIGFNIVTLVVFCLLVSRYINPIIAALLSTIMFFLNHFWGMSSPSYNSLASNFGILSYTCLIYALNNKNFKKSLIFIIASSFFLFLTIASYISMVMMVLVPFILLVYFYLRKSLKEIKLLIIFICSLFLYFAVIFLILILTDILPIFIKNFTAQSSTRDIAKNLLFVKLNTNYGWFINTLRNGFSIIGIYSIGFFGLHFLNERRISPVNYFTSIVLILYFIPNFVPTDPTSILLSIPILLMVLSFLVLNVMRNKLSSRVFILISLTMISFMALTHSSIVNLSDFFTSIIPFIALFFINLTLNRKTASFLFVVFFIYSFANTFEMSLQYLVESIVIVICLLLSFSNVNEKSDKEWNTMIKIGLLWFIPLGFIFSMSSADGYNRLIQGVSALIAIGFVGFYRFHQYYERKYSITVAEKVSWRIIFFFVVLTLVFRSYSIYKDYLYNEVMSEVTVPFASPVLKGVYSTPKKVALIDELLTYLKPRVKQGDYFLTYYNTPMLYFLTHTRPSYGEVWADEESAPFYIRKQMIVDMKKGNKEPEYVVRMMVHPGHIFKDPVHFICEDNNVCPIDSFVHDNYYIDKTIYPFQIWRKGSGPILKTFEKFSPNLQSSFRSNTEISESAKSFFTRHSSEFVFSGDKNVLVNNNENKGYIQLTTSTTGTIMNLGYIIGKDGLNIPFESGDVAVMTVEAQVKRKQPTYFPIRGFVYINDDMSNGLQPEKNDISIYSDQWEGYVVSKKIREGTRNLNFIINWQPAAPDDYINIKSIKIYILKNY